MLHDVADQGNAKRTNSSHHTDEINQKRNGAGAYADLRQAIEDSLCVTVEPGGVF